MSRMQSVSETCESEMSALAWFAPKVEANCVMSRKLVMKGLAKPLVIWSETPSSSDNMNKCYMWRCLKSVKARRPSASTRLLRSPPRLTGHEGSVMA